MNHVQKITTRLLAYLAFYGVLILVHGYTFGANDQMDFMPYARHIQDSSLYIKDFYIDCIGNRFNERWLLAYGIAQVPVHYWPAFFLVLHAMASILLIHGLVTWAGLYFKTLWIQCISLVIVCIVLYNRNLGGNELYYNMVCASLLAKSTAIWALYYSYQSRLVYAITLTAFSTYVHPIVGAQIFVLSFIFISFPQKLKFTIYTLLLITPYLYALFDDLSQTIPSVEFVQIMYLRNAHHFFPGTFGVINYLILVPFFLAGIYGLHSLDRRIFRVSAAIIIGCLVYTTGMLLLPKYTIMSQWFKSTIWLKFFCTLGVLHFITHIQVLKPTYLSLISVKLVLILCCTSIVLYKIFKNKDNIESVYQLPGAQKGPEIQAALQAKTVSNQNDVFLVPPDYTSFKYFSERSTYVDWKAIPHNGFCLREWMSRIKQSYGLSSTDRTSLSKIYLQANNYLSGLSSLQKADLKSAGVSYILYRPDAGKEYFMEKL